MKILVHLVPTHKTPCPCIHVSNQIRECTRTQTNTFLGSLLLGQLSFAAPSLEEEERRGAGRSRGSTASCGIASNSYIKELREAPRLESPPPCAWNTYSFSEEESHKWLGWNGMLYIPATLRLTDTFCRNMLSLPSLCKSELRVCRRVSCRAFSPISLCSISSEIFFCSKCASLIVKWHTVSI